MVAEEGSRLNQYHLIGQTAGTEDIYTSRGRGGGEGGGGATRPGITHNMFCRALNNRLYLSENLTWCNPSLSYMLTSTAALRHVGAGAGVLSLPPHPSLFSSALLKLWCCDKNSFSCKSSWIKTMNASHGWRIPPTHSQLSPGQLGKWRGGGGGWGGGAKKITYPWSEPLGL